MLRRIGARRALGRSAVLALLAAGAVWSLLAPDAVAVASRRLADACADAGPLGWGALVAVQVGVAASGILPASLIGVLAGTLYGPALGFALAAVGTLAGACVSFALTRRWFGDAEVPGGRFARIDAMIARGGWRAVCLVRLSPVMPFALASWTLSLTSVSTAAYLAGTLAALPALLAYVLLGSLAHAGDPGSMSGALVVRTLLLGVGAGATLILAVLVRRALGRSVDPAGIDAAEARP